MWMRARLQENVDRAALRMHDRLAGTTGFEVSAPRASAAMLFSVALHGLALAAIVGMGWSTAHATGGVAWVLVVVGWLVVLAVLIPQRPGLPDDVTLLDPSDAPYVHQLVAELARAVGAPLPARLGVDPSFNAYVSEVGWRGETVLVIGLPLWAASTWEERLGVVGHELGHLRGRDTARGRLLSATSSALQRNVRLLLDPGADSPFAAVRDADEVEFVGGFEEHVARALLRLFAVPPFLVLLAFERLRADDQQYREYLSDRRAALATGASGLASSLSIDVKGLHTIAVAAVHRGDSPFAALEERAGRRTSTITPPSEPPVPAQAPGLAGVLASEQAHRWDATHPPTPLRIDLLSRMGSQSGTALPSAHLCASAQGEVKALQQRLTRQVSDDLLGGYF